MGRIRRRERGSANDGTARRWRVAAYIRLSREDGGNESLSVSNQRKILLEFVERFFPGACELAGFYVDDGQSGTDYDRPAFRRMLEDIEDGRVNCVLCKNLSRAFRNYSDQGYFLESFFPRHSVRFITLGDPQIDTYLNPEAVSGMEIPISGLMNDRFACKTSLEIRRTFDTKRRRGEFIGAFAPYGYAKAPENKNRLIVDPEAARIVRMIFEWCVYGSSDAGMSKEGIARRLNRLGIPSPAAYKRSRGMKYRNSKGEETDGLWSAGGVGRILSNEVYTGVMIQGRQRVISYKVHDKENVPPDQWYRVPKTHEPIISRALFERAGELMARNTRSASGEGRVHRFSGLLRCADCGGSMTRKYAKGIVYYNCSTYKRKAREKCTIHSMRLDVLEAAVLAAIQEQIEEAGKQEEIIENIEQAEAKTPCADVSVRQSALELRQRELARAERALDGLYLDWKQGELSQEQYDRLKKRLREQIGRLQTLTERLEKQQRETEAAERGEWEEFLESKTIRMLSQGLLTELIETIWIHEGGGITILFRFEDPKKEKSEHLVAHKSMEQ